MIFVARWNYFVICMVFNTPHDLKFALIEASEGKVGTTVEKVILSCFAYDNTTGRYTASAFGLMRLAGVITMFFRAMVTALWRRERRHSQQVSENSYDGSI